MVDRREFFKGCAVLLGSSLLPIGCGQGGSDAGTETPADTSFNKSSFVDMTSTRFSVSHDTYGAIDLTLTEVDDEIFSLQTEQFSIALSGPELPFLDEGKYQIYNSSLGYFELYLQPGEASAGEQRYRATFSLLQT